MLKRYFVAALCLFFVTACPALAAGPFEPAILHAQVLLDRAGFSPGIIDGRRGGQLEEALKAYQTSHGLKPTGAFDDDTNALLFASKTPAVIRLTISQEDAAGPFTVIPPKLEDQAKLPALGYSDLLEELCERYHTSPNAVAALNPNMKALGAGVSLLLPNVATDDHGYPDRLNPIWRNTLIGLNVAATQPQGAMVVVDGSEGVLRVYDKGGQDGRPVPASDGQQP